ncbi:CBS domain-containing protein [Erythrobacter arachoides]|uniref:CBS domain-containing protein n=1 Tax=Aurantiacibacter arachoides TaxID=1850444 RepID=A0A845A267_9SPHN|nr:CBS domain-containing protein [Aurantiacibacter arachoides]MXO94631.1 CBS domain-containing protein [Aurantiacibacter arachoides]GGD61974.1 histidine kinase [Aurantiacibacter arachoides]
MTIAKIIESQAGGIVTCAAGDSALHAASLLAEKRIGAMPVMDGETLVGIFSERDLLYCVARDGAEALDKSVSEMMTSPAITIEVEADALKALSLMSRRRIRHLPVMEADRLVGFVSIGDLVKYRMDRIQQEAQAMRDYITLA